MVDWPASRGSTAPAGGSADGGSRASCAPSPCAR
uniref:Uncharacterized protein n=1 Tax=Arundo donax TaxID=35708 RepID=A0A0A9ES47_ARUDO